MSTLVQPPHPLQDDLNRIVSLLRTMNRRADKEAETWAPLGDYPDQVVIDRISEHDGPAVAINSHRADGTVFLHIEAIKNAHEECETLGEIVWRRVTPGGALFPGVSGFGIRSAGESTFSFSNEIPSGVIRDTLIRTDGIPSEDAFVEWVLTGREVPYSLESGRMGAAKQWKSQTFRIYRNGTPA